MMDPSIFAPANAPNLREVVYEKLKDAVVAGVIPAGAKLSELDLSKQFDVSRTPVREAIRQLAETGLVTLEPRRGAFVLLPTAKDISDLYEIRLALESVSVRNLCASPPADELYAARNDFDAVSNDWDGRKFMQMDAEFHSQLARLAKNKYLVFTLDRVSSIAQLCRHYAIGMRAKVRSSMEHLTIIDAILSRDPDLAAEAMKIHLINTRDALLEYVSQHPEAAASEKITAE